MLEVARRHPLVDPDRLIVTGISQGGGITLAAAGLASMAGVSFGGRLPTYRSCATFGGPRRSPTSTRTPIVAGWRHLEDAVYHTLGYLDGVNLARRASAPALFSVAFDG